MKSFKVIFWSFLLIAAVMQGCGFGKYDDGPLVSFYPDRNRLCNEWKLNSFYVNGEDSTSQINCSSCPFFFKFSKSGAVQANYMINGQLQTVTSGTWNFQGHDKQINITTTENVLSGPIMNSTVAWDVTRSTKKQLWISHLVNGRMYEIELK
jgi:hypothetical protein